jgi:glycosyltransferase involved in cell wall biosynthesis
VKVLLVCGNLSYAGAQQQLLGLAKGLKDSHEVLVCSISSKTQLLEEFIDAGIKVEVLGLRKRKVYSILKNLYRIVKENEIEIVYGFLESANTYSRLLKIFHPALKIVSSERSSDNVASFPKRFAEKFLSRFTDLYIANSHAGKNSLAENYGVQDVEVIHNGIDLSRALFTDDQDSSLPHVENRIVICQVGRIKPDKNYEMFLKVAEKSCSLNTKVIFVVVGDHPKENSSYWELIREEHARLKHQDRIRFIGSRGDVPQLLSQIDISVLTSHREGCSNAVLESMFAKCPLVVTDVGDNRIMLSDTNKPFLVEPGNVDMMVDMILALVEDESMRKSIGADNFKKAMAEYTNEQMVAKTESALKRVLNNE